MIPREGKLHITWEARHLMVTLKGSVRQGTLTIDGSINRNKDLRDYTKLDNLVVDIYFTNADGKVLRHAGLHSSDSPPQSKILHTFQHSYKLPKNTTHIAFGYDIKSKGHHFQHNPFK
jgi:hypothetical protein